MSNDNQISLNKLRINKRRTAEETPLLFIVILPFLFKFMIPSISDQITLKTYVYVKFNCFKVLLKVINVLFKVIIVILI